MSQFDLIFPNFINELREKKSQFSKSRLEMTEIVQAKSFQYSLSFQNPNLNLSIDILYILSKKYELLTTISMSQRQIPKVVIVKLITHLLLASTKANSYFIVSFGDNDLIIYHSYLNFAIVINNQKRSKSKRQYKLFLQYFALTLYNFLGEDSEIFNNDNINNSENFQMKLFELFFASPLITQYEHVIKYLFTDISQFSYRNNVSTSSDLEVSSDDFRNDLKRSKLKNCYIIDYFSKEVIFELNSMLNKKKKKKYYLNKPLLNDVIFQCDKLVKAYMNGKYKNDNSDDIKDKYVILELESCYPRLIFFVKFFPMHNGFILVELYNIYRLSHDDKKYNEIDVRYPSEIVCDYIGSPRMIRKSVLKKLPEIERFVQFENFIIEYFSSINSLTSIYVSHSLSLKYFDKFLLQTINTLLRQTISFDELITNTNQILFDHFLKISYINDINENVTCDAVTNNDDTPKGNNNFLQIDPMILYSDIFKDKNTNSIDISPMNGVDFLGQNCDQSINDDFGRRISEINTPMNYGNEDKSFIGFDFGFGTGGNKKSKCNSLKKNSSMKVYFGNRGHSTTNLKYSSRYENKCVLLREMQQKLHSFDDNGNFFNKFARDDKRKSFQIISRKGSNYFANCLHRANNKTKISVITTESIVDNFFHEYQPPDKIKEETFRSSTIRKPEN